MLREDTAGDPTARRGVWTGKRLRTISRELAQLGLRVCPNTVRRLLGELDYAPHANRKSLCPSSGPEREQQFHYLSHQRQQFHDSGYPIISVDTKKKDWWVNSRIKDGSGAGSRSWSKTMTSVPKPKAWRSLTGFTTCEPTAAR